MGEAGPGMESAPEALIEAIYDAVEAPARWPWTLQRIAGALDAKSALLRTVDLRGDRAVRTTHHHNLDDDLQAAYRQRFVGEDPYLEALSRLPTGRMVVNHALVDLERFRRTEFYRHYLRPLDNHFIAGGFVEHDDQDHRTVLGFHRHSGARQFDPAELGLVQTLTPHVRRSLRLQRMLGRERARSETSELALDTLSVAACLLDGEGRLQHANARAERLLEGPGAVLGLRDGRVLPTHPAAARRFRGLLERARQAAAGTTTAVPLPLLIDAPEIGAGPLVAVLVPMTGRRRERIADAHAAPIALYVGDLDDTGLLRPELLETAYGLTRAEARLAVAVGRGATLAGVAADQGVAVETVRSHLKRVLDKTGTGRQAELVRLLAAAPWKIANAPADEEVPE